MCIRDRTPVERADIQAWVQAGGVLVATSDLPSNNALGSHYGLTVTSSGDTDWKVSDQTHPIMDGPFGLVGVNGSGFSATGVISYFSAGVLPSDTVIARDSLDNPTMLVRQDGDGLILFIADEGIFRADTTGGGVITTANDRLSANIFAWAISNVEPSEIHTLNIAVDPVNDDPSNSGSQPADLVVVEDTETPVDISNITSVSYTHLTLPTTPYV